MAAELYERGQMPGMVKPTSELTAWHGTPHNIQGNKFSNEKIGTGEGAQAYGYGHYVAEGRPVAEDYRKKLADYGSPYTYEYQGKQILDPQLIEGRVNDPFSHAVRLTYHQGKKFATDIAKMGLKDSLAGDAAALEMGGTDYYQKMLDAAKSINKKDIKATQGFLYKTDVADEIIPKMLDWDKPVNLQTPEVKTALTGLAKETPTWTEYAKTLTPESLKIAEDLLTGVKPISGADSVQYWKQLQKLSPNADHNAIIDSMSAIGISDPNKISGRDVYNAIASTFDVGQKEAYKLASEYLKEKGITGIRYLDQGSRSAGKGTRNMVVFDPEHVTFLERNDVPIERQAGGKVSFANSLDAMCHELTKAK
jgi:hypothetical protein